MTSISIQNLAAPNNFNYDGSSIDNLAAGSSNSAEQPHDIVPLLRNHSLFSSTSNEFIEELSQHMRCRIYQTGDIILREGDPGKAMFVIMKGFVQVGSSDGERIVAELGPGAFFGEIGVLFEVPRTASVIATTKALIAVLTGKEFNSILNNYPEIAHLIRQEAERRYHAYCKRLHKLGKTPTRPSMDKMPDDADFLLAIPSYQKCPDDMLKQLRELASPISILSNAAIINRGEAGNALFIILSGTVEVVNGMGQVLTQLSAGMIFGETAVMMSTTRTQSVVATTDCMLASFSKELLDAVIFEKFPVFKEIVERLARRNYNHWKIFELKKKFCQLDDLGTVDSFLSIASDGGRSNSIFQLNSSSPTLSNSTSIPNFAQNSSATTTSTNISLIPRLLRKKSSFAVSSDSKGGGTSDFLVQFRQSQLSIHTDVMNALNYDDNLQTKSSVLTIVIDSDPLEAVTTSRSNSNAIICSPDGGYSNDFGDASLSLFNSKEIAIDEDDEISSLDCNLSSDSVVDGKTMMGASNNQPNAQRMMLPSVMMLQGMAAGRRRASIAVWADPQAAHFAQQNTQDQSSTVRKNPLERFRSIVLASSHSLAGSAESGINSVDSDDGAVKFTKPILELVLHSFNFLELWKLRLVHPTWLQSIQSSQSLLQTVNLGTCHKLITDKAIEVITHCCGAMLEVLILKGCWRITDRSCRAIAGECSTLMALDLGGCWEITEAGITALSRGCTMIRAIDLSNCRKLNDAAMYALCTNCAHLTSIIISYCKMISNAFMGYLATSCSQLRRLNLQRCTGVTDDGFTKFSQNNHAKLQELILSDCSFLTNTTLRNLSVACKSLRVLNLSFCCSLTEESMLGMSMGFTQLQVLDASFCGNFVSDASLATLTANCLELTRLSIRGCVRVTDQGVLHLILSAKKLSALNLTNCNAISKQTIECISSQCVLLSAHHSITESEAVSQSMGSGSIQLRRFTCPR